MMASLPTTRVPTWATGGGADVTDPGVSKQADGWDTGEAPANSHFNWWKKTVGQYIDFLITGSYNIANAAATGNSLLDTSSQDSNAYCSVFSDDGAYLYVSGDGDIGEIHQYSLSVAFDETSATLDAEFSVNATITAPRTIYWNDDGTIFYVMASGTDAVYAWDVTTPWDLGGTVVLDTSEDFTADAPAMVDFCWSSDGLNIYVLEPNAIHQYTVSSTFDIGSTIAHQSNELALGGETSSAVAFDITPDDTRFWVSDGSDVWEYAISRATAPALTNTTYTGRTITIEELALTGSTALSLRFGGAGRVLFTSSTLTTSLRCF